MEKVVMAAASAATAAKKCRVRLKAQEEQQGVSRKRNRSQ